MDKQECINELRSFVLEIQNILDFIQTPRKSSDEKYQAQEMLKIFKNRLETAYKTRDKARTHEKLTDIEKAYFFPAVHEAFANLTIKTNSTPNEKWGFELVDTQNTIQYYLGQLEE